MMYEFKIDDAERFAQEQGLKAKRIRNELVFQKCPYCGSASRDEEKFAINLQTGQFNCLRASCGAKGNMLTLARDFDFSLGRDADTYYRIGAQRHYRVFKKNDKPIEPNEAAIEYLKGRGIQSLNGKGRGDEYVKVTVEVPKNLSKRQKELLQEFDGQSSEKNYQSRKGFFNKLKELFEE